MNSTKKQVLAPAVAAVLFVAGLGLYASPAFAEGAEPKSHETAEHEEVPGPINWADFSNKEQPPYLAGLVNFAILLGIYVYFGRKPVAAALETRRGEVAKQIEEAQRIKREAETRSQQYAEKLGALTDELTRTRATLVASGVADKARIVREAEEKAARIQKDALFLLEQERRQLTLDLRREAVQAALASAEVLLRSKLTAADQERLAEEFLVTLVPAGSDRAATAGGAS